MLCSCRCWFQFAGVVPNIPVELDITNRSDVLHQVDRAKVSGQSQAPESCARQNKTVFFTLQRSSVLLAGYPLRGYHSVCVISMKYRIIFYYHQPVSNSIIVYIANTSHPHARTGAGTHTRAHAPAPTPAHTPHTYKPPSLYRYSMPANRDGPLRW